jgi:hypothetical protein
MKAARTIRVGHLALSHAVLLITEATAVTPEGELVPTTWDFNLAK